MTDRKIGIAPPVIPTEAPGSGNESPPLRPGLDPPRRSE